jgi:N-acetylneuraminic acid mutarotase
MFHQRYPAVLFALCATLAGCDNTPTRDLTSPDAEAGPLDPQSASLLAPNTWTTRAQMLSGRWGARAGTLNNVIYVVGGVNAAGSSTATVQAYDVATNTWSTRRSLPSRRAKVNGVSEIGGKLYVSGGLITSSFDVSRTLFVYDPAANTWTRKADMPQKSDCGVQGVIGGQLYVYAHCLVSDAHVFIRYNPATNNWTTLAAPPERHLDGDGGVISGKFYLTGGLDDHANASLRTHAYNPATNTWVNKRSMPAPQTRGISRVLGGKLYIAGGFDNTGTTVATLRAYNPVTNTWATRRSMPTARQLGAGAAASGQLYVIGGQLDNGTTVRKVEAYTP